MKPTQKASAILHVQRAQHLEELERVTEYGQIFEVLFRSIVEARKKDCLSPDAELLAKAGQLLAQDCVEHLAFVTDDVRADLDKLEAEQGASS